MGNYIEQALSTVIVSVISLVVGWLISSFRMVPRGEFTRAMNEVNERLREIENEQKDFVTREEFRNTMRDIREDLQKQHSQLSEQLATISAALITRGRTRE